MNTQSEKSADQASRQKASGHKAGAKQRTSARSGGLLPVAALIIALASAATAGWLWRQLGEARDAQSELATAQARELAGLEAEIDQLSQSLSGLDDLNSAVGKTAEQMATELSVLRGDLGQMRGELVNQLNAGVQDRGAALLLSEAEQLMRIASYQLLLRRNPTSALDALTLADERLAEVNDPLMVSVRETLAREMRALASVPATDIAGAASTLAALAEQAVNLPLRRDDEESEETPPDSQEDTEAGTEAGPSGENATGDDPQAAPVDGENRWTELMDDLGQSLGRLVRVQKHDENMAALLTPDDERLMRQNLQIKFETARLALLERQSQIYQDTLQEAQRWLRTYFDTGDEAVDAAIGESDELLAVTVEPMLPDISDSLRQLRTARETLAQSAAQTATQTATQAAPQGANRADPEATAEGNGS